MFLVGLMVFHAVLLWPELVTAVPARNDSTFHLLMARGASEMFGGNGNPLDFWIPQLDLGFPQFLYYQHLPHLLIGLVHRLLFGAVPVDTLFNAARVLLLVTMPLTVYWSLRRLGYARAGATLAAAASTLFSADNRMGLEYNSYVWRGLGLFSQLVAVHLTFVVIACFWTTLREGRAYWVAALAAAALVLSHLMFGPILAIISVVMVLLAGDAREVGVRTKRLLLVGAVAVAVSSYMLVPFAQSNGAWLSTMPWAPAPSYGMGRATQRLLTGQLLDHNRLPVLSLLTAIGLVLALRVRDARARFAAGGMVLFALLFIVRPDKSGLGSLVPAHAGFLSYRLASLIGVFAVLTIGLVGDRGWNGLSRVLRLRSASANAAAFALLASLMFAPALVERWQYFADEHELIAESEEALRSADGLSSVLAAADERAGRIFAGPVTTRTCPMHVGPSLCLSDLLNARGRSTVGNAMQNLSLPAAFIHAMPAGDAAMYDLFDVRSVVIERTRRVPAFFTRGEDHGNYTLYTVGTSGVAEYIAVSDRRGTQRQDSLFAVNDRWLRSDDARARRMIRWDYPASAPRAPAASRPLCTQGARTLQESVQSQEIVVRTACDAAPGDTVSLMLKMAFHPHWRVQVDGNDVEPYMVSPGFLAVDLPTGVHTVTARYRAHPAKIWLLCAGLLVLASAAWGGRRIEALPILASH